MQNVVIFVSILILLPVLYFLYQVYKKIEEIQKANEMQQGKKDIFMDIFKRIDTKLDQNTQNFNNTLRETNKTINERLDNAAKVIGAVQKNIGEMSEIGRGMQELQEFLKSPKLRGNVGEQVLKELLGQVLPAGSFNLQYSFKNGSIVDAAIKTQMGIIPIDSKFPLENFRKLSSKDANEKKQAEKDFVLDVKKHIDSISKKYILTNEGTIDYALMYVPSESVYYEIVNNSTLFDYSSTKRVLPVSPTTFYAYLRTILVGFEGQKISQKAQEILSGIRAIQKEYEKMGDNLDTLSKHINNSHNMMSQVETGYMKLGQQIKITGSLGKHEEKELLEEINSTIDS